MTEQRTPANRGGSARIVRGQDGAGDRSAGHRSGRRAGNPDTRGLILDVARECFARSGFARCTVREIAAAARVDPALIHHYFGSKQQLFLAAVRVPVDPGQVVAAVLQGPAETLGRRLIAAIVGAWESPAQPALVAAVRSALADPGLKTQVQEFLVGQVISPVLHAAGCPADERPLRGSLLASQVIGLLLSRYVLAIEPVASLPASELIPHVGATLQRYLTGPLDPSAA